MSTFLDWLLAASAQGAVVAVLVIVIGWALGHRLAPRWRAALWLLVLARLALPESLATPWSLFNLWPQSEAATPRWAHVRVGTGAPTAHDATRGSALAPATPPPGTGSSGGRSSSVGRSVDAPAGSSLTTPDGAINPISALGVWLVGAVGVLLTLAFGAGRVLELHRASVPLDRPDLDAMAADAARRIGLRHAPRLYANAGFDSPAVVGWLRPRLVLPEGLAERLDSRDLQGVLLHELAHIRRGDIPIAWLAAAVLVVHWFNPLVWVVVILLRRDRELACDAMALAAMQGDDRPRYGPMLLMLLSSVRSSSPLPGLAGIVEGSNATQRRIAMIARFRSPSPTRATTVIAALLLSGLALVTLTDARQPAAKPAEANPDVFGFYTQPYKADADGLVRLGDGVRWHVQSQYLGIDDQGTRSVDDRLTVVLQDEPRSFWPVIMRLNPAEVEDFQKQLARAIENRRAEMTKGAATLAPEPKGLQATLSVERLEPDANGMSPHRRGRVVIDPAQPNLPHQSIELTWYVNTPASPQTNFGSVKMPVAVAEELLTQIAGTRARREGRPIIATPAAPARGAGSSIKLYTKGLNRNEHGAGVLGGAVMRVFPSYRGVDADGKPVVDERITIVLDHPAAQMWHIVAMIDDGAAARLIDRVRLALEERARGDARPNAPKADPRSTDIIVGTLPYKADADGIVTLPAATTFDVMPEYHGVKEDGTRIVDPRVTLILKDEAQSFWPLVARLGQDAADRFAQDLAGVIEARKKAAGK